MSSVWCCLVLRSSSSRRVASNWSFGSGRCLRRPQLRKSLGEFGPRRGLWDVCPGQHRETTCFSHNLLCQASISTTDDVVFDNGTAICLRVHSHEIFQLAKKCRCRIKTIQEILRAGICCLEHPETSLSPPGNLRCNSCRHKNCAFSFVTRDRL